MFKAEGSHAAMMKPRAVRPAPGLEQYRSYEAADESTRPRSIGRPMVQPLRRYGAGDEDLPTSTEAPTFDPQKQLHQAVRAPQQFPSELQPVPSGPTWQARPAPKEDGGGPSQLGPHELRPYEPAVPGYEDEPMPGEEDYPSNGGPTMNGGGTYMNGGGPIMNGGAPTMNGGDPVTNGAMVPGADAAAFEAGFPGQQGGAIAPVAMPAPVYTQPWFWGLAAAGAVGVGALYWYSTRRRTA
jgi:hypothetical protein